MLVQNIYYLMKPMLPRKFQISLRRGRVRRQLAKVSSKWPIDQSAGLKPANWQGWPENKQFALVLTHDVETAKGQGNCVKLMQLEERLGFRSAFYFVPERYQDSPKLRDCLARNGFEVGLHGLKHDGKLYKNRALFLKRAGRINYYLNTWQVEGFRSPSMHHNLDWIHDLDITYDASTFDTDPFEPQSDGVGTIFPFWVNKNAGSTKGYLELPYTLPQDFTLFIIMQETSIDIWKEKLAWIAENGGMALLDVHPDYMRFNDQKPGLEEYPAKFYTEFLEYVHKEYNGQYWHGLPKEIARKWNCYPSAVDNNAEMYVELN